MCGFQQSANLVRFLLLTARTESRRIKVGRVGLGFTSPSFPIPPRLLRTVIKVVAFSICPITFPYDGGVGLPYTLNTRPVIANSVCRVLYRFCNGVDQRRFHYPVSNPTTSLMRSRTRHEKIGVSAVFKIIEILAHQIKKRAVAMTAPAFCAHPEGHTC